MNKSHYLFTFLVGTPVILIVSFILLFNLSAASVINPTVAAGKVLAASTSDDTFSLPFPIGEFSTQDARIIIIKNYLRKYSSPLEDFAPIIVETSDKYSLDYRLLVAIAQQESNLCKRIPENSHNCWGFGIYGDKVTRFESYPQALETVAKTLKRKYIDIGLDTPEEIMAKYTPPSIAKGGPWARGVNQFMTDLE